MYPNLQLYWKHEMSQSEIMLPRGVYVDILVYWQVRDGVSTIQGNGYYTCRCVTVVVTKS